MKKTIHILAIFTMLLTFFLIFVGALIKSTEAGLSVPDWPTTFGENMFLFPYTSMVGGIFYEHSHRLIASLVGFCILLNTILIQFSNFYKLVKVVSFITLCAVITQGILGGLTVLYFLPAWLSASHGTLGQTTFCLTIILAVITSPKWYKNEVIKSNLKITKLSFVAVALVWTQLIIGAIVRHTESALVALDFPKINDTWIPAFDQKSIDKINYERFVQNFDFILNLDPITSGQLLIHFTHRSFGYIIFLFMIYYCFNLYKQRLFKTTPIILFFLIITQIALGALTVLSKKEFIITSLHVSNGAAILGILVYLCLNINKSKLL